MCRTQRKNQRRHAFTLLEVLMVIVILGILAAVVVPQLWSEEDKAKIKLMQSTVDTGLNNVLNLYRMSMGRYPEELTELIEAPDDEDERAKWGQAYVKDESALVDAWGNEWYYECPGEENPNSYDLGSNGPDGEWGTDDDIKNWKD
ncbi:MAG: type II secretion system major pseudopilin GspG [Phycisphaerae bacterium]|nr:type II secretion system major pseudopilin GspG [Phycisphaerae bacterium]